MNVLERVPEVPVQERAERPPDDRIARRLRGFGPLGVLAILVILFTGNVFAGNVVLPVGAVLVLVWARWSRTPWGEIGYVRPKSWIGSLAVGIAFGIAFKVLMKMIVMPLLGAPPINPTYHYLAGNRQPSGPCLLRASEKRPFSAGTCSNASASSSDRARAQR